MHIFYKTLLIFTVFGFASGTAIPSWSAEQNSYRPGNAYLKTAASDYRQCAQQCQGDAACRGWNFIRPSKQAASGICEFNAVASRPISSPVSISGAVRTEIDALMSRAVHRGTNTVRVGTPSIRPQTSVPQNSPQRKTVRQPPPQQRTAQPATLTRPVSKPALASENLTPRVYGAPKQISAPNPQKRAMSAEQVYYRQQYLAHKQQLEQQRRQGLVAPQSPRPIIAPPASAAPQPLYGSLHDDLSANMTRIPRPKTAPDDLSNPHAPVATSRAVPTRPVETGPLKTAKENGLAGGRP